MSDNLLLNEPFFWLYVALEHTWALFLLLYLVDLIFGSYIRHLWFVCACFAFMVQTCLVFALDGKFDDIRGPIFCICTFFLFVAAHNYNYARKAEVGR